MYNKKYIREKEYIFNYTKNLLKDKSLLSRCYIYSIDDNDEIKENPTEELKYDKNEEDLSILNINNEEDGAQELNQIDSFTKKSLTFIQKSRSKTFNVSDDNNISEEIKCTLIIVPPHRESENEQISFQNKKYSSKGFDFKNSLIKKNGDDDDDDDNLNEDIIIENKKTTFPKRRKNSFFNSIKSTNIQYGSLEFDIVENNNLLEKEDDVVIYKELKPKAILKNPKSSNIFENQKKISLINDFETHFNKEQFVDFISGLHLMRMQKGILESCTLPNFRGFKIAVNKKMTMKKKKKKKIGKNGSLSYYGQVFPVKRLNFEIGIFSLFILGIFAYLSYLVSNTYY